jgi:hypothetical protein
MNDHSEDEFQCIEYEVKKIVDNRNRFLIEGNHETIKLFLELMEQHIISNAWDLKYSQYDESLKKS